MNRLDKAFHNFFRRVKAGKKPGFPRYKGKERKIRSFDIPNPIIKRVNKRFVLNVKGIGKFRFKAAQEFGKVKNARIVTTPCRIKVQLLIDEPVMEHKDNRPAIGIDAGISNRFMLSNGDSLPKRERNLGQVVRCQKRVSRAVKGSKSRNKKRYLLAKAWQRVAERERGYLHEAARQLVNEQSSKFYVEDLEINNMVKNHKLAKSIHEQMWGTFVGLLTHKAENAGGFVKKVNPRNTSQRCSNCGMMPNEKLTLKDREYKCQFCGLVKDRDWNAACNILQDGIRNSASLPGGKSAVESMIPVHTEIVSEYAEQYA